MTIAFLSRPIRFALAGAVLGLALIAAAGFGASKPASAGFFQADLHVTPISGGPLGAAGFYQFKVTNNGISDASSVVANGMCWYTWGPWVKGDGFTGGPKTLSLGTVKAGESRTISVFCPAMSGKYLNVGYKVTVNAANELDMSDNSTGFGHYPY